MNDQENPSFHSVIAYLLGSYELGPTITSRKNLDNTTFYFYTIIIFVVQYNVVHYNV